MALNQLTISGYSTALFATWYFVDELSLLLDCGDGVCAGLLQKSRKVKHVFISHADRDHLAGLLQFSQLNSRPGLKIYYPRDSGSFPALERFTTKFDPQVSGAQWIPIGSGEEVQLRDDIVVRTLENRHVKTVAGQLKSLSFFIENRSLKLRPELVGKTGSEIAQLRKNHGQEAISTEHRSSLLAYSADTPIEMDGRYNDVETLIHEATFLRDDEIDPDNPRRNRHSSLEQVLTMVAESNVKRLILGHFSSRYDDADIDQAIRQGCDQRGITIPVYRLLPGQRVTNVLEQENLNRG